ncbi:HNH endonuclease [Hoyosella rhizosphaerae]|uniref:GmrSD restriction endonucleases C-terminal domain-containing protein n=1 Tax=Hoyosella rhizosphaerae TaxID=1755582 RepID=A0A916UCT4_9ACTN|nr:HNH endonuclease family protein [Hoyosella rhizosphaerae]MBN4925746.1 HNH endonuclease [Hoyosella rhizosphaerae]GGC68277.1 hypothetical protein GCM10011410_21260 [Hoyosella rhizosphaerae]
MSRGHIAFTVDKQLRGVVGTKTRIALVLAFIVVSAFVVVLFDLESQDEHRVPQGWNRDDVSWHQPGTPATASEIARWQDARALLDSVPVRPRGERTGYDRSEFGPAWSDQVDVEFGRNGCDTRNDILIRDFHELTFRVGDEGCVVAEGEILDPFTLETIAFTRGVDTSAAVQVDHVVALSDAWQKGAQQLSYEERMNFANDPLNLQATAGWANQQKGDSDAASWLPPNKSYRCTYVSQQIEVKSTYSLWVTKAERDAMLDAFSTCLK